MKGVLMFSLSLAPSILFAQHSLSPEEVKLASTYRLPLSYSSAAEFKRKRLDYSGNSGSKEIQDRYGDLTILTTGLPTGHPYYSVEVYSRRKGESAIRLVGLAVRGDVEKLRFGNSSMKEVVVEGLVRNKSSGKLTWITVKRVKV